MAGSVSPPAACLSFDVLGESVLVARLELLPEHLQNVINPSLSVASCGWITGTCLDHNASGERCACCCGGMTGAGTTRAAGEICVCFCSGGVAWEQPFYIPDGLTSLLKTFALNESGMACTSCICLVDRRRGLQRHYQEGTPARTAPALNRRRQVAGPAA